MKTIPHGPVYPINDPHGHRIYDYVSPIKSREISIFQHSMGQLYAEVVEEGKRFVLPVRGYPKEVISSRTKLQQFSEFAHFVLERNRDGNYSHAGVAVSLKGGMLGEGDVLPSLPGLAIGSVIHKVDLKLPLLHKRYLALRDEIIGKEMTIAKHQDLENSQKSPAAQSTGGLVLSPSESSEHISPIVLEGINLRRCIIEQNEIAQKIVKLQAMSRDRATIIREMLPIDTSERYTKIEHRSFYTDKYAHTIFTYKAGEKREVRALVGKFLTDLFLGEDPSIFLPSRALDSVSASVDALFDDVHQQISVIGAYITLTQVRLIDPVKIRPNAKIGKQLTEKIHDYYVLTEAVLGGVFLGYGRRMTGSTVEASSSSSNGEAPFNKETLSSVSSFSYISQGALLKKSRSSEQSNLWDAFDAWREGLNDKYAGYPIGFRVRRLRDIFIENNREVPKKPPKSSPETHQTYPPCSSS